MSRVIGTFGIAIASLNLLVGVQPAEAQSCIVTTDIGGANDEAFGVAILSNGQIVVGGKGYTGTNDDFAAVRYNYDFTLDSSFDTDGMVTTNISGNDQGRGLAIQSDGKIVLVGHDNMGGPGDDDFTAVRYNTDGSLDTTFDSDGKVTTPVDTLWDFGTDVAIQSDGRIVIGGYARVGGAPGQYDFAVVRYDTDGSLDTTFDSDGKVVTPVGASHDYGNSIRIQTDGKILLAGATWNNTDWDFAIVRYNSDGSLDTSFDSDGIVVTPLRAGNDWGGAIVVQPDDKIVFAGQSDNGTDTDFAVVRYNSDGSLDTSFDSDGMVFTPIGPGDDAAVGVVLQPDGKIVVAGRSFNGTDMDFALVRYNPDGSLDTSFDSDGIVTTPIGSGTDTGRDIAIQNDGKLVVAGTSNNGTDDDFALVRYNTNGSLDMSCGLHYRSIGSYSTGDATIAMSTTTVDFGGGASIPTDIQNGDGLIIDPLGTPEPFTIVSRNSNTQVTVAPAAGAAHTNQAYVLYWEYDTGDVTILEGSTTADFGAGASLPTKVGPGDKLGVDPGGTPEPFFVLSR